MKKLMRNTWVEINLNQLDENINLLRQYLGNNIAIAAVIKADAYGHGAAIIAEELALLNVDYIAVAILSEAIELRNKKISSPILVMGYTENDFLRFAVEYDITTTIFEYEQALILSDFAKKQNKIAKVHIKVDTGFNRLGAKPTEQFANDILKMKNLPNLYLEGIFSHFRLANQYDDEQQYILFKSFAKKLKDMGINFRYYHISDSIASLKYKYQPENKTNCDSDISINMARPGAIIYGYLPKYQIGMIDMKPIMKFKTRVTRVQRLSIGEGVGYDENFKAGENCVIATLPVGYADGYPRSLSNIGEVLINKKRAKVVGIVCMDQMMVDVSNIENVKKGDEAILFGSDEGEMSIEEAASLIKTNKNNIISGITRRVPRVYLKNGEIYKIVDYLYDLNSCL